jgi:cytochrome c-type biogenesis protein CcmH
VLPAVLGVVLAVSLAIGSGIGQGHPSAAQRARAIEALVRCPSCEDLSVLDSSASSAVAVRNEVAAEVAAGWSDRRIEDALVARYGGTILLRPPTTGLTAVVWIVPAVAGAGALAALGALFWRRSRAMASLVREGR